MKKLLSIAAIIGCLSVTLSAANFGFGLSGSDEGIDSFSLSIGDFYGVPVQEVREVEYYVPHEHASIVYFLANHSRRDARYITDLRRSGLSWWNISLRLGLDPYNLYVGDNNRYYGKSRHHRMHDSEIADYVNVRFISDYHHINRHEVLDRRRKGERYQHINESYRNQPQRHENRERIEQRRDVKVDRRDDRRDAKVDRRDDRRDAKVDRRDDRRDDKRDDKKPKSDKNQKENSEKRNGNSQER